MATDNIALQATTDVSGATLGARDDGTGVLWQGVMMRYGTGTDQTEVQSVSGSALPVEGPLAHDAVMPVGVNINVMGGFALATAPTAVGVGDAVRAWFSRSGALNVNVVSGRDVTVSNTALPVIVSGTHSVNVTVSNTGLPVLVSDTALPVVVSGTPTVNTTVSNTALPVLVSGSVSANVTVSGTGLPVLVSDTALPVVVSGNVTVSSVNITVSDTGLPVLVSDTALPVVVSGTPSVNVLVSDTPLPVITHPFVVSAKLVQAELGATGAITVTDAFELIAAPGTANEKIHITSVSVFNTTTDAAAGTVVNFTDGATGPTFYSGFARHDGGGWSAGGIVPLFILSATTALSVKLNTVSGAVRVNVAGYTAT